jgi:hypothetical protein
MALTDGLPTDEVAAATDLDDIELCEDDYRLFNTTESEADVQHPPPIPTAVHMGSADGTVLAGSMSSGVAVPTSWRSGREEYAARSNAASFLNRNRTPPTFSSECGACANRRLAQQGYAVLLEGHNLLLHEVRIPSDVKVSASFRRRKRRRLRRFVVRRFAGRIGSGIGLVDGHRVAVRAPRRLVAADRRRLFATVAFRRRQSGLDA